MMRPRAIPGLVLVFGLAMVGWPMATSDFGHYAAWADDDDDDDDGDSRRSRDDDDDDGNRRSRNDDDDDDGRAVRRRDDDDDDAPPRRERVQTRPAPQATQRPAPAPAPRAAQRRAPVPAAPPPPDSAPDEIVALALTAQDLTALTDQGFRVVEAVEIPGFGTTSRRLEIPQGVTLGDARDIVRALPSGEDADFNHYYRSEQGFAEDCSGLECPARISIGWPALSERASACGRTAAIGMIDTGINDTHETFEGARLEVRRLMRDDLDPSRAIHGTAVAALLVGDPQTRSPGLVPGSTLIAIDAFHRQGGDERADVFTLIEALGLLAERDVGVINLSLAGPPNSVLADLIDRLVTDEDIVVVSAVGNLGPNADPAYPAAYAPVLAVTAVDRDGNVYRRAVRGPHVDLAAPGVGVWTAASISGARPKTGTSFAVPFVSAAAAMLREERPDLDAAGIGAELVRRARDAGPPGRDPTFGAGILSLAGSCAGRN